MKGRSPANSRATQTKDLSHEGSNPHRASRVLPVEDHSGTSAERTRPLGWGVARPSSQNTRIRLAEQRNVDQQREEVRLRRGFGAVA
jgi:hypothetical protein